MNKKRRPKMEYRYYEIPPESPVLALFGEKWVQIYGKGVDELHFHNHLEIGYCHYGQGYLAVEEEKTEYRGGTFTAIPKDLPHITVSTEDTYSCWEYLYVDVERSLREAYRDNPAAADLLIRRVNKNAILYTQEQEPAMAAMIRQILELMKTRRALYLVEVKALTLALLLEIAIHGHTEEYEEKVADAAGTIIAPALEHISKYANSPIRVKELADACHISETHFRRVFQEAMNSTPTEYLNWVRIRIACDQLKRTDDSVAVIAAQSGFSTLSTFNRNFRQLMGVTPSEWRKDPEYYEQKLLKSDIRFQEGW